MDARPRMTRAQLHVVQHSLGLDEHGQGRMYRNHFVAGGEDVEICRSLVTIGLMQEFPASDLTGGDPLFRVTERGKRAVGEQSPPPPKLTRGQRRYREWLRVADCFPDWNFGDWLRRKDAAGA